MIADSEIKLTKYGENGELCLLEDVIANYLAKEGKRLNPVFLQLMSKELLLRVGNPFEELEGLADGNGHKVYLRSAEEVIIVDDIERIIWEMGCELRAAGRDFDELNPTRRSGSAPSRGNGKLTGHAEHSATIPLSTVFREMLESKDIDVYPPYLTMLTKSFYRRSHEYLAIQNHGIGEMVVLNKSDRQAVEKLLEPIVADIRLANQECKSYDYNKLEIRKSVAYLKEWAGKILDVDELKLAWQSYKSTANRTDRDKLVGHYLRQVRSVADYYFNEYKEIIDRDDLISWGTEGLLDAIENFDPTRGYMFTTYSFPRIRGEILDTLRKLDVLSRKDRQQYNDINEASNQLEQEFGRPPTTSELAEKLGIEHKEIDRLRLEGGNTTISLDAEYDNGKSTKTGTLLDTLEANAQDATLPEVVTDKLELVRKNLQPKEWEVLRLYFFEDLTMREIAIRLDLSESRICQIQNRALVRLKEVIPYN